MTARSDDPRPVYRVNELFYTLQGEGRNAGRAAVFCRFSGCNLWSGREEDRAKGPSCSRWCDTNFRGTDGAGGGVFTGPRELAIANAWPGGGQPFVVLTGGEPLLQVDDPLLDAVHAAGFWIAVETNETRPGWTGCASAPRRVPIWFNGPGTS